MRWRIKSTLQNLAAMLPERVGMPAYYMMQRSFGALRGYSPSRRYTAAVEIFDHISSLAAEPRDRTYFEVGTGRVPVVPMLLWLMGAKRVISVDLNRYLIPSLTASSARYIATQAQELREALGHRLVEARYETLQAFISSRHSFPIDDLLELFSIDYRAPADASDTGLPSRSVDYHVSYTVLEHVDPPSVSRLLLEARRVLARDGIAAHFVDYSDHFSHSDNSIDAIHFLRFSESQWSAIASNRFMYANRLRDDDYVAIAVSSGFTIARHDRNIDPMIRARLAAGYNPPLDVRFRDKAANVLSTTSAWLVRTKSS